MTMITMLIVGRVKGILAEPASQVRYAKTNMPAVRARGYPWSYNPGRAMRRSGYTNKPRIVTLKYQTMTPRTWKRFCRACGSNSRDQVPPADWPERATSGNFKFAGW